MRHKHLEKTIKISINAIDNEIYSYSPSIRRFMYEICNDQN